MTFPAMTAAEVERLMEPETQPEKSRTHHIREKGNWGLGDAKREKDNLRSCCW